MDRLSPEQGSWTMSHDKGKDTKSDCKMNSPF